MTHGPTRIPSKGACIYCNRSGVRLTDEHILPLSLGGSHVIEKASCDDCARITSRFEGEVARNMWGDARNSYSGPSRRKKKRPTIYTFEDIGSPGQRIMIPFNEYPAGMVFYLMHPAGILIGAHPTHDQSKTWQFRVVADEERIRIFEVKYPGRLVIRFKHVPDEFARLIAKIGYGQILCSLDPSDFDPICVPYILGKKDNPSYIVGGRWSIPPPIPGIRYELSSNCVGTQEALVLVAEIRLFANCHTPVYHAVVGTVSGAEHVARVIEKLAARVTCVFPDASAYRPPTGDDFHWLPRLWPPSIVSTQGPEGIAI